MAFTDYKNINSIAAKHPNIVVRTEKFLPTVYTEVPVPIALQEEIDISLTTYRSNEFFATECLVSPLLRHVWKKYLKQINMWTHQAIKYDDDLCGVPDYMFTHLDRLQYELLSYPIVTTVEAKAENFVEGWAQCIAQMIACQKLNQKENVVIYGIVTTGKIWEFGKIEKNLVTKDTIAYSVDNLPKLISRIDFILSDAVQQLN